MNSGNPFFGGNSQPSNYQSSLPPLDGNLSMADNFKNFASAIQGNPEEMVKSLLASGQMSQEQFNQFSSIAQMAQSFPGFFK